MNTPRILDLYRTSTRTLALVDTLAQSTNKSISIEGLKGSSKAFAIASLYLELKQNHVVICNDEEAARYLHNDLEQILPKKEIHFFPDAFKDKGDVEHEVLLHLQQRTETLNKFYNSTTNGEIIITYPEALFAPVVKPETLQRHYISFKVGREIDLDNLIESLVDLGFERTDFVYDPGCFSMRGGIIDLFTYTNEHPYRIELFGNTVESIRTFSTETQLSIKRINEVNIIPTVQQLNDLKQINGFFTALNYNDTALWFTDFHFACEILNDCWIKAERLQASLNEHYTAATHLVDALKKSNTIFLYDEKTIPCSKKIVYNIVPQHIFNKKFDMLVTHLNANTKKNYENFIFSNVNRQLFRLHSIFEDLNAKVKYHPVETALSAGFVDNDLQVAVYTDHQIFERYHKYQTRSGYNSTQAIGLRELKNLGPGDFVTHIDHGVGRFSGLEKLEMNGQTQEMVRLIYQNNDILYVNINSLYKITKYIGKEGTPPKMNKLGSDTWDQLKRKTKSQVKDIAKDLITLYAKRKAQKGHRYPIDSYMQLELEASFMYEDTPDQAKATLDFKKDMESDSPMDRLICGDVGFGKTEIALRAAFKAVCDGKQVALLVPTTILASQHYKTFKNRFENFPVTVDYVNRFKTSKDKTETLKRLQEGKIDIIIGTHSLITDKVKFKDLGLFIIDEEQKFGVAAKEKIKSKKINVDTLTLTATPIPRTMQFSLMGARDLSIINTAPSNRQPVSTRVITFQMELIKEAIYQEVSRGGQVYFIHNRVKDIGEIAARIKEVCPNIDIGVAHGQMEGPKLEMEMLRFVEREYDVLIATNIIEAGLDIPNANTIFINNAHHFGLSDLHQLRGRVGRSNKKAYCYLMAPPLSVLPSDSRRRLQTLEEYSDLGSGFSISMRDLDIRGAGNLLGGEQSGFIADIGYDTYQKIINEAIRELKETDFKDVFEEEIKQQQNYVVDCQVDTDFELWIPDNYISSINERVALYTELNSLTTEVEITAFAQKLIDRFGTLPKQVEELFDAIRLQWIAKKAGIEKIILKQKKLKGFFIKNPASSYFESDIFNKIVENLQRPPHIAKLEQSNNLLSINIVNIYTIHQAKEILQKIIS